MKKRIFFLVLILFSILNQSFANKNFYIEGENGAVSCGHPIGVKAALEILSNGGNAVDAAVACGFAMGVVDFSNSGLGGDGFALVCLPNCQVVAFDGSTKRPINNTNIASITSVIGLPTSTKMMLKMIRMFGSKKPSEILSPAVAICINGFEISTYQEKIIEKSLIKITDKAAIALLAPNGIPLRAGSILRQPKLAKTLLQIGHDGGLSFYSGKDANVLVNDMQKRGSTYSLCDLYTYDSKILKPAKYNFKEYCIYGTPAPSSSEAAINFAFNLLNKKISLTSTSLENILCIAKEGRKIIDAKYKIMSECFNTTNKFMEKANYAINQTNPPIPANFKDTNTTHICVMDSKGMAVSMTLTLGNHFGSKELSPLGFFYNNSLNNFIVGARYPDNYPANAGPVSSKSPILVTHNKKCIIALGGAGADRIITNTGLILAKLLNGYSDIDAVKQQRFFIDHQKNLNIEWNPELSFKELKSPYKLKTYPYLDDYFGLIALITRTQNGKFRAIADPRRDGSCGVLH